MKQSIDGVIRGYVLISGGLDSRLAVCVLREQGIEVTGISFSSPFFSPKKAKDAASQLGIPLVVEEFTTQILDLVEHPPHGFGSNMNPCIDCHTCMIKMAGQRAEREGFQFLATGEVLNQRPMSQTKRSLGIVGKGSGYADWLVRPLSAKLLDETEAERLGWVDRSRLLALSGRSRKPQYELAKKFGITSYPSPGGGCCLTEPNFSARLKDLRNYGQVKDLHAVELLKHGRHFRLSDKVKVLVGRDEKDNAILEKLANPEEILIETAAVMGPAGLITGGADEGEILLAASLCARHSDQKVGLVEMIIKGNGGERRVTVECATPEMVDQLRVK